MKNRVYKILTLEQLADLREKSWFDGSDDDLRDGFIHLSSGDQVAGTLTKYFAGQDVVVLTIDARSLGTELRFEPSRGGALFPHLYARLNKASVLQETKAPWIEESHDWTLKSTL